MKPFSKSEWITPAAFGAVSPLRIVQARVVRGALHPPRDPLLPGYFRRQVLAAELDTDLLDSMTTTIGLADTLPAAERILAGQVRGRTVVDVTR